MDQIIKLKRTTTPNHPPASLDHGELAAGLADNPVKLWIGTPSGVKPLLVGGGVIIASVAPDTANAGDLWWDNTDGRLYVWFEDAWVGVTDGGAEGGGEAIDPIDLISADAGNIIITGSDDKLFAIGGGDGPQMGVTDGSNAAPGEIGEFFSVNRPAYNLPTLMPPGDTFIWDSNITLTAGDWMVVISGIITSNFPGTGLILCGLDFSIVGAVAPAAIVTVYYGSALNGTTANLLPITLIGRMSLASPQMLSLSIVRTLATSGNSTVGQGFNALVFSAWRVR